MTVKANARLLGSSEFGVTTVISDDLSSYIATANGFSATTATAHMLGRFTKLMSLNHPHLCEYVEFVQSTIRMFYIQNNSH